MLPCIRRRQRRLRSSSRQTFCFRSEGTETIMADISVVANPLREGMRIRRTPPPCSMVIFGASGDLTQRKLIPALYDLHRERLLPQGFSVIGCAKTPYTNEKFREAMADAVRKFSEKSSLVDETTLASFTESLYYLTDDFGDGNAYSQLGELLKKLDRERGTGGNRLFYLATPPSAFPVIIRHLASAGLAAPEDPGNSWTRIVIEKPFGHDLESARAYRHGELSFQRGAGLPHRPLSW